MTLKWPGHDDPLNLAASKADMYVNVEGKILSAWSIQIWAGLGLYLSGEPVAIRGFMGWHT